MDDLISRQALCEYALNQKDKCVTPNDIMRFPSAQPETHEERTETHGVCLDTISRQEAIAATRNAKISFTIKSDIDFANYRKEIQEMFNNILDAQEKALKELPSAQPTEASCWGCNCPKMERLKEQKTFSEMVHLHDAETHEERTETHACDCISRQAAIDSMCELMRHWFGCDSKDEIREIKRELGKLPSAQPEQTNSWCINSWCIDCKEYDTENKCCPRYNRVIKQTLDDAYRHGETEAEARYHAQQRWIPCSDCERRCDKWEHSKTSRE